MLAAEAANIVTAPRVIIESAPKSFPATESIIFSARAPLAPEVKLPDYAAIAKKHTEKKEEAVVSDEEHAETLKHLKRERARITKVELGMQAQEAHAEAQKMEEKDLPALDDEFVKSLGYESLEKFSDSVRSNLKTEKEMQALEKTPRRNARRAHRCIIREISETPPRFRTRRHGGAHEAGPRQHADPV